MAIKKFKKNALFIVKKFFQLNFLLHIFFGRLKCPVCERRIARYCRFPQSYFDEFFKHRFIHSIFAFETLNIPQFSCPICGSSDSQRLYAIYLRKELSVVNHEFKILDFAPSPSLAKLIKFFDINYRSADLYMEGVDDKIDITDMKTYANNYFDMIICAHVLEHVEKDKLALIELFRVLKPGGKAIIQVPILTTIHSDYENDLIKTADERWRHFGQGDHVRIFSKEGFVNKLENVGFRVEQLDVDYFGKDVFNKYGIAESSVLYIANK